MSESWPLVVNVTPVSPTLHSNTPCFAPSTAIDVASSETFYEHFNIIDVLCDDVIRVIFSFLPSRPLFRAGLVCHRFRLLSLVDAFWRSRFTSLCTQFEILRVRNEGLQKYTPPLPIPSPSADSNILFTGSQPRRSTNDVVQSRVDDRVRLVLSSTRSFRDAWAESLFLVDSIFRDIKSSLEPKKPVCSPALLQATFYGLLPLLSFSLLIGSLVAFIVEDFAQKSSLRSSVPYSVWLCLSSLLLLLVSFFFASVFDIGFVSICLRCREREFRSKMNGMSVWESHDQFVSPVAFGMEWMFPMSLSFQVVRNRQILGAAVPYIQLALAFHLSFPSICLSVMLAEFYSPLFSLLPCWLVFVGIVLSLFVCWGVFLVKHPPRQWGDDFNVASSFPLGVAWMVSPWLVALLIYTIGIVSYVIGEEQTTSGLPIGSATAFSSLAAVSIILIVPGVCCCCCLCLFLLELSDCGDAQRTECVSSCYRTVTCDDCDDCCSNGLSSQLSFRVINIGSFMIPLYILLLWVASALYFLLYQYAPDYLVVVPIIVVVEAVIWAICWIVGSGLMTWAWKIASGEEKDAKGGYLKFLEAKRAELYASNVEGLDDWL